MSSEQVTVRLGNDEFDVAVSGAIYASRRVGSTTLDEARLAAADTFLLRRDLTKEERAYWAAVRNVTPEHKRFAGR